jgi:hypothetical protein
MSSRPPSSTYGADRASAVQSSRHARSLISRVLAYFATHAATNLSLVRGRLLQLLDAGQPLDRAQDMRSAYTLLSKHSDTFNRTLQSTLKALLEEEMAEAMPRSPHSDFHKPLADSSLDGLTLSLIDLGEVERVMLVDRIAQRFTPHYEAGISSLGLRLTALLGRDSLPTSENPFRPQVFLRAFMQAWEKSELDDRATDELMLALAPAYFVDLAPLYADLNAALEHAGIQANTTYRIRKSVGGGTGMGSLGTASGSVPLQDAQASEFGSVQSEYGSVSGGQTPGPSGRAGLQGSEAPAGSRSAWSTLAPVGRNVAQHARQFLQRLGFGGPSGAAGGQGGARSAGQGGPRGGASGGHGGAAQGAGGGAAGGAPGASGYGGGHSGADGGIAWDEAGSSAMAPLQEAPDAEFLGYLGDLQAGAWTSPDYQQLEGQDPAANNILRQMRDMEEVRRAPELDRGTVDALAEVFDFVFADQSIPLQMKYVIGRLQIPVLKAAMIDRDFFLSAEHPARRLVDTLATASVAWAPEKGENDPLYVRIESTVQRVLTEFENDLELFSELLADFSEFLFETEQQAQNRIEPVADQELSVESFDQALGHVDEVVHARLSAQAPDSPVVRFLAPFLTKQWRQVMARAWVASEQDPTLWDTVVKTMDQLIWSIQPKTTAPERRELVAVLPDLVRNLNAGLDSIEWGGDDRANFTRRLIATHMLAIRMTQPVVQEVATDAADESAAQEALKELDERRANKVVAGAVDEFDAMAQSFTRGLWFDFVVDENTRHRCRLSWVSPMRTRMLFTNREGFDAFVRSEREVAELLRSGQLVVIDQQPIVGRALDWLMAENNPANAASSA